MRIAYFSPLNPIESGISDYSEDLLPWLAAYLDIDLFVDGYRPSNAGLAGFAVHDARRFPSRAGQYDAVIYQMGNSPAHAYIYRMLLRHPGIVVLHEHVLHHLISWMSWDSGDARIYLNEFRYCYGTEGEKLARRVITGQVEVSFFDYPLSDRVIRAARGLIVHSEYVQRAVRKVRPDAPLHLVPMGVPLPVNDEPHEARRGPARARLGVRDNQLVIGSFGHINPFKRIDVALRAFSTLCRTYPDAVYLLVGSVSPNYDVIDMVRMLGLEENVRLVGYADAQAFQDYVTATDICINLRYPSAGETSASLLRLMGAGLPVLVSRTATFEDLPAGTCVPVDVDECETELVVEYLRLLAGDIALRRRIGENARRYVATRHTMEQATLGYLTALQHWYPGKVPGRPLRPLPSLQPTQTPRQPESGGAPPTPHSKRQVDPLDGQVRDMVAQAAVELGLGNGNPGLTDAARAWAELRGGFDAAPPSEPGPAAANRQRST